MSLCLFNLKNCLISIFFQIKQKNSLPFLRMTVAVVDTTARLIREARDVFQRSEHNNWSPNSVTTVCSEDIHTTKVKIDNNTYEICITTVSNN